MRFVRYVFSYLVSFLVCFFLLLSFSRAPRRAASLISTSTPLTLASQLATWLYFYSMPFPFCMHLSFAMCPRCTLLWHQPGRWPWIWAGLYVDVIPLLLSRFFISLNMSILSVPCLEYNITMECTNFLCIAY